MFLQTCALISLRKEIILHERKRHTARRITSSGSAALSPGGGGGSTPIQPDKGVRPSSLTEVSPFSLTGGGRGTDEDSPLGLDDGNPPLLGWMGVPPPPYGQTDRYVSKHYFLSYLCDQISRDRDGDCRSRFGYCTS